VDQTQITKVAWWPALTSPAPERGWIRTHSCGVTFLGFGLGELGFGLGELELGLGFGELGFGLGVVVELGVGVVVAGVDDVLEEDEDEDVEADVDVPGLDERLLLSDLRDDADVLADLNRDADEVASAAADSWLAALVVAADNCVLAGISGHDAELMIDLLLASAACSSANMLQPMNAKPDSAPSAAGLTISALTCESSCAVWLR
jgi:hypothetical protein